MVDQVAEAFTEENLRQMFSDCTDSGASLNLRGDTFVLEFPSFPDSLSSPPTFTFSLLDDNMVSAFSEVPGLSGTVTGDEFLGNLDVISAKLLTAFDSIDRGV